LTTTMPDRPTGEMSYRVKGVEAPKDRTGHDALDLANYIESALAYRKQGHKDLERVQFDNINRIYQRWSETADRKNPSDRATEALLDYWFDHAEKAKPADITEKRGTPRSSVKCLISLDNNIRDQVLGDQVWSPGLWSQKKIMITGA